MLFDCLDHPTPFRALLSENKTGRQYEYVNFNMLRKKLHSIVVELPLRRIGGVETLLYFSGRRKISSVHLNKVGQHLKAGCKSLNSVSHYAFI